MNPIESVYPNTVRASMVVYTFLPLDAEVLGLDPVRLPEREVGTARSDDELAGHDHPSIREER